MIESKTLEKYTKILLMLASMWQMRMALNIENRDITSSG